MKTLVSMITEVQKTRQYYEESNYSCIVSELERQIHNAMLEDQYSLFITDIPSKFWNRVVKDLMDSGYSTYFDINRDLIISWTIPKEII